MPPRGPGKRPREEAEVPNREPGLDGNLLLDFRRAVVSVYAEHGASISVAKEAALPLLREACVAACTVQNPTDEIPYASLTASVDTILGCPAATVMFIQRARQFLKPTVFQPPPPPPEPRSPPVPKKTTSYKDRNGAADGWGDAILPAPPLQLAGGARPVGTQPVMMPVHVSEGLYAPMLSPELLNPQHDMMIAMQHFGAPMIPYPAAPSHPVRPMRPAPSQPQRLFIAKHEYVTLKHVPAALVAATVPTHFHPGVDSSGGRSLKQLLSCAARVTYRWLHVDAACGSVVVRLMSLSDATAVINLNSRWTSILQDLGLQPGMSGTPSTPAEIEAATNALAEDVHEVEAAAVAKLQQEAANFLVQQTEGARKKVETTAAEVARLESSLSTLELSGTNDTSAQYAVMIALRDARAKAKEAETASTDTFFMKTYSSSKEDAQDRNAIFYLYGREEPMYDAQLLLFLSLLRITPRRIWRNHTTQRPPWLPDNGRVMVCVEATMNTDVANLFNALQPVEYSFCGVMISKSKPDLTVSSLSDAVPTGSNDESGPAAPLPSPAAEAVDEAV